MTVEFRTTAQGALEDFVLAAAVVLTRGRGEDLELYVVHRSPKLRAFPDTWALPGGRVDAVDGDARSGDLDAFRACALRELFEETGVAGPGLRGAFANEAERDPIRRALTADEERATDTGAAAWRAVVERSSDPLLGLEPVCWTTTPRISLRRFRALYVHLELPEGEVPSIHPGELVDGRFARPADLLREWRAGELRAVPPLAFLLESAERHDGDFHAALADGDSRSRAVDDGGLHAVYQVPGIELAPLLTPTLPPAVTTNCVLPGHDLLYVVDPATYDVEERRRLIDHLERRSESSKLEGVVVTHHHHDHVGSVAAVAAHFGLPVFGHPLTLERLPETPADPRPLVCGDRLPLGTAPDGTDGWELQAIHTPGHDRGHLAFRDSRYGHVIAGDLVSTLSTILIDPPEGDLAVYLDSLERVRATDIGALIPAHGGTAHDGCRLIDSYLRHREQRELKLLDALAQLGPTDERSLLERTYDDVARELWPMAARSLRAGIDKLVREGRVVEEGPMVALVDES